MTDRTKQDLVQLCDGVIGILKERDETLDHDIPSRLVTNGCLRDEVLLALHERLLRLEGASDD